MLQNIIGVSTSSTFCKYKTDIYMDFSTDAPIYIYTRQYIVFLLTIQIHVSPSPLTADDIDTKLKSVFISLTFKREILFPCEDL